MYHYVFIAAIEWFAILISLKDSSINYVSLHVSKRLIIDHSKIVIFHKVILYNYLFGF